MQSIVRNSPSLWFWLLLPAALLTACSPHTAQLLRSGTTEERFKAGMDALKDNDYQEAEQFFNTIILQDPTSDYADDAQFYLGESYFRDGDYKLAAFNYNRLRNAFPNSPFVKQAFFQSGESYYLSSPTYDRDQRETKYAIDVFHAFASIYPSDSLTPIANTRVAELEGKLARKDFMTAQLYMKMEDYKSAVMYYDLVIQNYPSTEFAAESAKNKVVAQRELDELRASSSPPSPTPTHP